MPKEIIDQLIKVKSIGNEGAHEGEEVNRAEEEIENALQYITDFSLSLFVSMLKKYGLYTPGGSWIAPVLSTLPPIYRIKILDEYIETEQTPLVVEKLSMAYLKNGMDREAFQVLKKYHELRIIDDYFFSAMNEKLKILKLQMNKLPIAQNL